MTVRDGEGGPPFALPHLHHPVVIEHAGRRAGIPKTPYKTSGIPVWENWQLHRNQR